MFRWTALLLIAALAWPMGEAAAVVCDPSAMEAMPCCEQSMGDCGMPGLTGDCCIVVPGEELPPGASSLSLDSASICRDHLVAVVVPVPAPALYVIQVREEASARAPSHAEPFFVRTSVLRI